MYLQLSYRRGLYTSMLQTIKRGTSKLRDASLSVLAKHILENMASNAHFLTPSPSLAVIQTLADDYAKALAAAEDRDKVKVIAKNERKKSWWLLSTSCLTK